MTLVRGQIGRQCRCTLPQSQTDLLVQHPVRVRLMAIQHLTQAILKERELAGPIMRDCCPSYQNIRGLCIIPCESFVV